jgi:hypothetical protein
MRTVKHIYYPRDIGSPIHGSAISFQILNDRTRHQLHSSRRSRASAQIGGLVTPEPRQRADRRTRHAGAAKADRLLKHLKIILLSMILLYFIGTRVHLKTGLPPRISGSTTMKFDALMKKFAIYLKPHNQKFQQISTC